MVQQKAIKQGWNVDSHNFIMWCMLKDFDLTTSRGVWSHLDDIPTPFLCANMS